MNLFQRKIATTVTKEITEAITEKGAKTALEENGERCCYQSPAYNIFFGVFFCLGILLFLLVWLLAGDLIAGIMFFVIFGGIGIVGIMAICFQKVYFEDDEEFAVRNFWGIKRSYRYADITGYSVGGMRVEVEVKGKIVVRMDRQFINRFVFLDKVQRACKGKKGIHKFSPTIVAMDERELSQSYDSGVLRQAMVIRKKDVDRTYWIIRVVHWCGIIAMAGLVAMTIYTYTAFLPWLLSKAVVIASLVLYFKFPKYCSMREKLQNYQPKEAGEKHKIAIVAYHVIGVAGIALFSFLRVINTEYLHPVFFEFDAYVYWLVVASLALVYVIIRKIFLRYSYEYRQYHLGRISFGFWMIWMLAFDFLVIIAMLTCIKCGYPIITI